MTYKKYNRVKKKSYHYNPSKRNSNKGIWNRLVYHHNKSCIKGDKNCKLKRFKNKCTSLKRKVKSENPVELVVTNKINLRKTKRNLGSEILPNNVETKMEMSDKKFDDLLELINTSSSIKSERFGSKDRLYNSMGEIMQNTYTCKPRIFDTLNSNSACFQTVVQNMRPNKLNEKNILKTFSRPGETNLYNNNNNNNIGVAHNSKRNNLYHKKKLHANSKLKGVDEIQSRKGRISEPNEVGVVSPSTPPQKPIRGSTKAWELLEGYEKHCEKKQKDTTWEHLKENTDTVVQNPYFL